jgi:hypothetical protein
MLKKLSFLFFFILDVYFTVSGLLYLRSAGEAVYGFLFLILMWYITWSIHKIIIYVTEKNEETFFRYYFSYLRKAFNTFDEEEQLGPTKFFRVAITSLSLLTGIVTILFLIYLSISTTFFTEELFSRYLHVFLNISIYPLLVLFLRTITSGGSVKELVETFLKFFPLRFTQLFIYMFTFLSPVAWFMIAFLGYISAMGGEVRKVKIETVVV